MYIQVYTQTFVQKKKKITDRYFFKYCMLRVFATTLGLCVKSLE